MAKIKRYKVEDDIIPKVGELREILGVSSEKDAVNIVLRWALGVGELDRITEVRLEGALRVMGGVGKYLAHRAAARPAQLHA